MKYKLPIASPTKPTITQYYGDKSRVAYYHANGIMIDAHNGVDFVTGDAIQTYGTRLVCPVPKAELSKTWWENPMSTSGNGIQIAWEEGSDRYNVRFWHCSEIVTTNTYLEGSTIAYIGNSGLCSPKPTPQKPFDGAHLHLMVFKNGVLIDPLDIFDQNQWFISEDSGQEKDLPPLFWMLEYAKKQLLKLLTLLVK
jgi:hypothetical protein